MVLFFQRAVLIHLATNSPFPGWNPGPVPARARLGKARGTELWLAPWPLPPRPSSLPWELCHCCPLWCEAITVRRGDQEMACPFLNSDQPENAHCTSLEGPFGCSVRERDLPPRGKAAPGIQLWAAASSHPAQSHRRYPACCQDGEVACFCLPAFVKEGLS